MHFIYYGLESEMIVIISQFIFNFLSQLSYVEVEATQVWDPED